MNELKRNKEFVTYKEYVLDSDQSEEKKKETKSRERSNLERGETE